MAIPEELALVGAALPGVAAALLSAYNWWIMRRGAIIKPDRFITYGLQNITFEEHQRYARKEKILYFPIILNNVGTKAGLVSNIEIYFRGANGANGEKKLDISKRVEVTASSIEEQVPPMPVSVPAGEGLQVTFECIDDENDVIPINEELICRIEVNYSHKRTSSIEFPFKLESESMLKAVREVAWFPAIEKPKPAAEAITDRDILQEILAEANLEDRLERILNREGTSFDRTTKFGGTKLVSLSLGELELTVLPESISKLEHLQVLYLGSNKLSSLPQSLGELKALRRLEVDRNQLSSLPESIGNLAKLEYLMLSMNQLSSLPENFGALRNLLYLNLNNNQLSSIPAESLGNLSSLEMLELYNNQLAGLPESFGNLANLRKAEFKKNKLTSLPETIGNLRKLVEIDLDENELTSLPDSIVEITSLRKFRANQNPLSSLPEGLHKLTSLKSFVFDSSQITALPDSVEQSLEALKQQGCSVYR
ncbi:MAG: leucine-rich repeat domain-containing protein [Candidatus Hodarchaeales archaeon]|jgi:Leucine-rich repeat (LRR) protein